jgi:dihydropteroate synthase
MGILNCTPDSFSDGGRFADHAEAIAHADRMIAEGAAIIDVGGESTRPGATPVSELEETARVVPVIAALRQRHPKTVLSIDTTKATVAAAALAVGADVVNDVSAGSDPAMLETVRRHGAAVVLMHRRGTPQSMQLDTRYDSVIAEVHELLARRAADAVASGIPEHHVWLDPGIGFGKDDQGNLELLSATRDLAALGHPIVVGPSRKSFIGSLSGAPVEQRLPGTLAALIPIIGLARAVVRVHEPAAVMQFLDIATRLAEVAP